MSTIDMSRTPTASFSWPAVGSVAAATAAGLAVGILTSYLQGRLPGQWNQLANSGAVWTLVAFAVALGCAQGWTRAALAGALCLVGEVAGYYLIAMPVRGYTVSTRAELLWTLAAVWIGPLAGLTARAWRRGTPGLRVAAALAVAGLLVGEGLYEIKGLGYPLFGRVEVFCGVAFGLVNLALVRASWAARLGAVLVGAVVLGSTLGAYTLPLLS